MSKYWFARRYPLTEPNATRMGPVSTEGLMVVTFFAACLLAGFVGMFIFSFTYLAPVLGLVVLVLFAAVGTGAFLAAVNWRGDKQHTIEEYKSGRVRQP